MSSEHNNGSDHVTWRDLVRALEDVVHHREIDRRLADADRLRVAAEESVTEARQLARAQVLRHDEEKNNLLAQINTERAAFAKHDEVEQLLEKLSTDLTGRIKTLETKVETDLATIRTTSRQTEGDVRTLQSADTTVKGIEKGRDLGIYGALFTLLGIVLSVVGSILKDILFP